MATLQGVATSVVLRLVGEPDIPGPCVVIGLLTVGAATHGGRGTVHEPVLHHHGG